MTRRAKIIRNIAIGIAALMVVVIVTAIAVVQTNWFRQYVKAKIITATEEGTGGRVEIGAFTFDWRHLRAVVTNFVIHGNEPAGSAPWIAIRRAELDLRLFSLHHLVDLAYLGIEQPEATVLVYPDGSTNIPTPKQPSTSNTTPLESVVDLAVGHFELTNGVLTFNAQKQALNVRGENLRAQLWYNLAKQGYQGHLSLQPIYVVNGRNTPVKFTVSLPVSLERDRIDVEGATITTPASAIRIDASMKDMRNPITSAHVTGRVGLADLKNCGDLTLATNAGPGLAAVDVDANATVAANAIEVSRLHLALGESNVEASGKLKDAAGNGSLDFEARLALGELGRIEKVSARPEGAALLHGTAKLDQNNNYLVTGELEARNVSFWAGANRIAGVSLVSGVRLDPHRLDLSGIRLDAWGGEVDANATLEDFARFQVKGDLRHLDLGVVAQALGVKNFGYDGVASGPIAAAGDLRQAGTRGLRADARIGIAPGRRGVPVSGRLNADYNGAADDLRIDNSYLALPHTRLTMAGAVGQRLNFALTTHDLNDLFAAMPPASRPAVALDRGGQATANGTVTGGLSSPRITAHVAASRFSAEQRQFDALALDAAASSSGAAVSNASVTRGPMQIEFSASVGLRDWKALPREPIASVAAIRNADLADVMALAGQPSAGYSGALTAGLKVSGTVGNPLGAANLSVTNGTLEGEHFDRLEGRVNMSDRLVAIPAFYATAGAARIDLSAEFQHPRDSFSTGRLHARVRSTNVNLAQLQTVQKQLPNSAGDLQVEADVTGDLTSGKQTQFQLTAVSADAAARNLRFEGQSYGDLHATAQTRQQTVYYDLASSFAGAKIALNGNTELTRDYPTTLDGNIANLPIEKVLRVARRTDIPAQGDLSGTLHFKGTVQNPSGNADFNLTKAVLYDEPLDHVRGAITYAARSVDISNLDVAEGAAHITLNARYDHPAGDLKSGELQFEADSSRIDLARIHNVQKLRPGLGGAVEIAAKGSATVQAAGTPVLLHTLDANIAANGISAQGNHFGDLTLTAKTSGGRVNFALNSNLASASIHGQGNAALTGDYPVSAELTFSNVTWAHLAPLVSPGGEPPSFDAAVDGSVTVNGPATRTDQLSGALRLTRVNLTAQAKPGGAQPVVIQNQGPIAITLTRGTARIDSLHLTGADTDVQAHGSADLKHRAVDLAVNANANLAIAKRLNRDIVSSGSVVLAATVRGGLDKPSINGKMELHDASMNYTQFPNGLSHANGVVQFNGQSAVVENLTAESGGGKVTLGGFVAFREGVRFGLRANAKNVRVLPEQGVSAIFDANLNLSGTVEASVASGSVTVNQVTYAPQSDIGAILSRATPPVESSPTPSPLLDHMKLDVQVRTATSMGLRASMAQNLELDANLHLRGTASQPGLLGRITITEGELVFFNSTYTVNTGTISFYNPVRIEPVLNLSLNTQAKGVDVVLNVTGPIDDMKLSYSSNPPLEFQEIAELLATGKTPTSDPTILANQPPDPPQTFTQMGESAVVSKALADPVTSRLQRVFGISQLSIDPVFTSGTQLPEAAVALTQRISSSITFTYVTALNAPNTQIINAQWNLNPRWAALASRDQNGIVSVRLTYKRQFR